MGLNLRDISKGISGFLGGAGNVVSNIINGPKKKQGVVDYLSKLNQRQQHPQTIVGQTASGVVRGLANTGANVAQAPYNAARVTLARATNNKVAEMNATNQFRRNLDQGVMPLVSVPIRVGNTAYGFHKGLQSTSAAAGELLGNKVFGKQNDYFRNQANRDVSAITSPTGGFMNQGSLFRGPNDVRALRQGDTGSAALSMFSHGAEVAPYVVGGGTGSLAQKSITNAVVGGIGSAGQQYADTGQIDPYQVGMEAGLGALQSGLAHGAKVAFKRSRPQVGAPIYENVNRDIMSGKYTNGSGPRPASELAAELADSQARAKNPRVQAKRAELTGQKDFLIERLVKEEKAAMATVNASKPGSARRKEALAKQRAMQEKIDAINNGLIINRYDAPSTVMNSQGNEKPLFSKVDKNVNDQINAAEGKPKVTAKGKTEVSLNAERLDLNPEQKMGVKARTTKEIKTLTNKEVKEAALSADPNMKAVTKADTTQATAAKLNTRRKVVERVNQAEVARKSGDLELAAKRLEEAAGIEEIARSQGTDAGRQLQAQKIMADELSTPQQKVFKLLDTAGVDRKTYAKRFASVDFTDTKQVQGAYRELAPAKFEDWLDKYRYSNMLSSPLTHIVNATSNATGGFIVAPTQKVFEGAVDAVRATVTGKPRTRFASEGITQLRGSISSIPAGLKEFSEVMTGKREMTNPDFTKSVVGERLAVGGAKGAADQMLSVTTRLLEAADRFSMKVSSGGEAAALTKRAGKGVKVGDIATKAEEAATYRSFRQELNRKGQGHILDTIDWLPTVIRQSRNSSNPVVRTVSKIAFPFVNTPVNLFKQGIEYSPLGITTLWGNADKTSQVAKSLMGTTAVTIAGATLAANDAITFSEPSNAKERDAFRAEGKQPYAIKIGDKWYGYSKLHPAISFNLALVAAVKDATDKGTISESASDKILSAGGGILGYFTDQSYMKNVGDLVSIFQSKDGSSLGDTVSSEGMNTANQLVPFKSMVSWIGRMVDPTQRKVDYSANVMEQIYQGVVKDIPGLNNAVPSRKNPYTGEPITNDNPGLNSVSPVRVTNDRGYGNTTGLNVNERQIQKDLPEGERGDFRGGVMLKKGQERIASQEKEDFKSGDGKNIKELSNGKFYAKVGDDYKTFDSKDKADQAIFKDNFSKSDKKSAVQGDTYYYKNKNGDVKTKPKVLYDWEQTDAKANLEMDRAYGAKDINRWTNAAQAKYDGLEKKKSLYDPETEQDEINKIILAQENLLEKVQKYASKGMGGSGGRVASLKPNAFAVSTKATPYKAKVNFRKPSELSRVKLSSAKLSKAKVTSTRSRV